MSLLSTFSNQIAVPPRVLLTFNMLWYLSGGLMLQWSFDDHMLITRQSGVAVVIDPLLKIILNIPVCIIFYMCIYILLRMNINFFLPGQILKAQFIKPIAFVGFRPERRAVWNGTMGAIPVCPG